MRYVLSALALVSMTACGSPEPRRLTPADLAGLDPNVAQEMLRQQAQADEERRVAAVIHATGLFVGMMTPPVQTARCERRVWPDGSWSEQCEP